MKKVIISGGGTGGHIFPALSVANALKECFPDIDILFVGAKGRMEMEKVPAAGYRIIGLPVSGFNRKQIWKNVVVLLKLLKSTMMARKIIRDFRPDTVIGVGGYASGPVLRAAGKAGIPTVLLEQNSYAGVTNKLLAKKALKICVAYPGMEAFFPKEKIVLTGNPVRRDLLLIDEKTRAEAIRYFHLDPKKKTILVLGGSLGAKTINHSILLHIEAIEASGVQCIWQTGKYYYQEIISAHSCGENIHITEFISRMDLAYSVADLIISRAGAGSISEFCLLKKPVILVPSPNVAEDHQTKNAMALVKQDAAILVKDIDAEEKLVSIALQTVEDTVRLQQLSDHIRHLALPDADKNIVAEIIKITATQTIDSKLIPYDAIYFVGAGGIGMSALIRYFLSKGKRVGGYDRTPSGLTEQLIAEGAAIHYEDNIALIPDIFKDKERTLIVFTPAVPQDHTELTFFKNKGFVILKRAQVLGEITRQSRGICISGTHGKTTTSSLTAHLLKQSHVDCNAFLGGILKNYNSNLLLSDTSDLTVIEADEYDRSFHQLSPYMAVITSADPDHLDIYGTPEAYEESFDHFTSLIRPGGVLLMKKGIQVHPRLQENVRLYTYSMENGGDFYAENIRIGHGEILFDYVAPEEKIQDIRLGVPLKINIENGIAAISIARLNGVCPEEIKQAMTSFQGAERRFDFHLKTDRIVLIDDYAHHPEELKASISSVRALYRERKLTVIFQPHLYSRTKDFYPEFAQSLSLADEVILLDIYPAREAPIPGVTSQLILDEISLADKQLCTKETLLTVIEKGNWDVVLMAGAGDIDGLVNPVQEILARKTV
jgi:UDP-N-acetylmuramate--alanine ligase